jgi:hypothetical protein
MLRMAERLPVSTMNSKLIGKLYFALVLIPSKTGYTEAEFGA